MSNDGSSEAPEASASAPSGDIQVIARSAQILQLFSRSEGPIRVADAAAETGLGRTTTYRYLSSLANADFLERDADGGYTLGPLMVQLGTLAISRLRVIELAGPHLHWLSTETRETAVISIWGGTGSVVARVDEPRDEMLNISIRVGTLLPIVAAQTIVHLAFMADEGRVAQVLATLPAGERAHVEGQIGAARVAGHNVSDAVTRGFRAIAVPIIGGHGIAGTMALVGTTRSLTSDPESGQFSALFAAATSLSRDLGFAGDMPFAQAADTHT